MGEAKRRRMALGKPIGYTDIATGERRYARNAGDPVEFLQRIKTLIREEDEDKRPATNVPCDGCTACCYHAAVDFNPAQERPEDLAHLNMVPIDDHTVRLAKREDGACVHLGETGCTVYAHRPIPCRAYDCRGMALVSMVDTFDGDRHSPVWIFEPRHKQGRLVQEAFRMLGLIHQAKEAKNGRNPSAVDTLRYAIENADKAIGALEVLSRLPPAQLTRLLGFDPRTVTPERHLEMMRQLTKGIPSV
jgi:Fe-S-cluster containining protein